MKDNTKAILFALLAFGLFSTHDIVIKTLGGTYSPFQLVFFSVLMGFPLVTMQLLGDKTVDTLIPKYPLITLSRTVVVVIGGVCAFYAFSNLPLAQTYAIIFAMPLLITIMAVPILGEHVGIMRGFAVLAGLGGVFVVLQPGQTDLTLAHGAALLCAFCGAYASVVVRKIGREERSVVLIIYPMVANFFIMALLMPSTYKPMPIQDLGFMFLTAAFALMANFCLIKAYRLAEAAVIAPMQYSQILWAVLYGALFFNESINWNTILGAAIIISSGLFIVARENSGKSINSPVTKNRTRFATPSAPPLSSLLRFRFGNTKTKSQQEN